MNRHPPRFPTMPLPLRATVPLRVALSVRTLLAAGALACTADAAAGQVATVDRGSFTITRDGRAVGREEFEIRSMPALDGATLEARGTATVDGRSVTTSLSTTAAGTPLSYRVEVRGDGDVVERATGQASPGRLRIEAQSAAGRAAREFPNGEGTVVLEDGVFHHYYFLARRAAAGAATAVVPRRNAQAALRVAGGEAESVTVGGSPMPATRHAVTDGDGPARTVWVDAEGRLLRVSANGLVAQRDAPPR
jgi:hypothetical protein